MTPSERLRALAREMLKLADELDRLPAPCAPAPMLQKVRWITTPVAMKVAQKSSFWLKKHACRVGFGHKLDSGSWLYNEAALRAYLAGHKIAREEIHDMRYMLGATIHIDPQMTDLCSKEHEVIDEPGSCESL